MPGGMPGMSPDFMNKVMQDPDVMAAMSNPATLGKLQEIMKGKWVYVCVTFIYPFVQTPARPNSMQMTQLLLSC